MLHYILSSQIRIILRVLIVLIYVEVFLLLSGKVNDTGLE